MKRDIQLQGLWRNSIGELSLATTPGGVVVGIYRRTELGEPRQYALSGHVSGNSVAFSASFPEEGRLASWTGQLTVDSRGRKLSLARRTLGDGPPGVRAVTPETYRPAAVEAAALTPVSFPEDRRGRADSRA